VVEALQLQAFEGMGLQRLLGDLGEIVGGYDLVGVDIGPVEESTVPLKFFILVASPVEF